MKKKKNDPGMFAEGILVIYSNKYRVLEIEMNDHKSCVTSLSNIILYDRSHNFGVELSFK